MSNNRILNVVMIVSLTLVIIIGAFGIVYELLLDKSIIPNTIFNIIFLIGLISLIVLIICIIINKKYNW